MLNLNTSRVLVSENLPTLYPNCKTRQTLILGEYHKMRGPLYIQIDLDQNHPKTMLILEYFYLGMKALPWSINLNGTKTNEASNTRTLLVSANIKSSIYIPEWFKKEVISVTGSHQSSELCSPEHSPKHFAFHHCRCQLVQIHILRSTGRECLQVGHDWVA